MRDFDNLPELFTFGMLTTTKPASERTLQPSLVAGLLIIFVVVLYWPVVSFQYLNYDDQKWIYDNPHMLGGLTWGSVRWAVTGVVNGTWCPLTNLSFMTECQLFGAHPSITHLINFTLHLANVLLLLNFSSRVLGWGWPTVLATFLFAVHPMNVEAVAWISDRKGLLSTMFLLIMLTQYVGYARARSGKLYWSMAFFYCLSLAAKPTAITVPIILLLLDVWPLGRFNWQPGTVRSLLVEKTPFFLLAGADALTAFHYQRVSDDIPSHPFLINLETAIIGYARYVANLFWPMDLNICYIHPGWWPLSLVLASIVLLALCGVTAALLWRQNKKPLVCLAIFIFCLAPVIELIPSGHSYMANRYAYFPYIWLFFITVTPIYNIALRFPKSIMPIGLALVALVFAARIQLMTWKNSITAFQQALKVNPNNELACMNLAFAYNSQGDSRRAMDYISKALQIASDVPMVQLYAGEIYEAAGQMDSAASHYEQAYELCESPDILFPYAMFVATHPDLGNLEEGMNAARLAMAAAPSAATFDVYATLLGDYGQFEPAAQIERQALKLDGSSRLYQAHLSMFVNRETPLPAIDFSRYRTRLRAAIE